MYMAMADLWIYVVFIVRTRSMKSETVAGRCILKLRLSGLRRRLFLYIYFYSVSVNMCSHLSVYVCFMLLFPFSIYLVSVSVEHV